MTRCLSDGGCQNKRKLCLCDGLCGLSCVRPEKECPELPDPDNGQVHLSGRHFQDQAVYTCDRGYTMVGASKRVCQTSGQWSGNTPECKHSARFAYLCIFTMIRKTSSSYFCIASKPTPSKSINYECNSQNLISFLCQWSALSILLWIPSHH